MLDRSPLPLAHGKGSSEDEFFDARSKQSDDISTESETSLLPSNSSISSGRKNTLAFKGSDNESTESEFSFRSTTSSIISGQENTFAFQGLEEPVPSAISEASIDQSFEGVTTRSQKRRRCSYSSVASTKAQRRRISSATVEDQDNKYEDSRMMEKDKTFLHKALEENATTIDRTTVRVFETEFERNCWENCPGIPVMVGDPNDEKRETKRQTCCYCPQGTKVARTCFYCLGCNAYFCMKPCPEDSKVEGTKLYDTHLMNDGKEMCIFRSCFTKKHEKVWGKMLSKK